MTDLLPPQFRESIGDADQEVIFDMAFNWSMAQHPTSLDFELLYTAVDALATLQSQDLLALAFVPHQRDRGFLFKGPTNVIPSPEWARPHAATLRERLKAAVHDRVGTVDAKAAAKLYAPLFNHIFRFAEGVRELHCFTTNYDRSVESIWEADLQDQIEVKPVLVRGFKQLSPNRQLEFDPSTYDDHTPTNSAYALKIYKLHGGLNWIKDGDRVFESPANDYLRRNAVVYPLRKHVIDEPFRTLLTRFQNTLKELDLLIVIGTSLRDEHLRQTLAAAMRANSRFKVIVLDPNAPALKESFGSEFEESIFAAPGSFGDSAAERELGDRLLEAASYGSL